MENYLASVKTNDEIAETKTAASCFPPRKPPYSAAGFDDLPPSEPAPELIRDDKPRNTYNSFVVLVRCYGFMAFAFAWSGYFFLLKTWPGPLKLSLCTLLGLAALIHTLFVPSTRGGTKLPQTWNSSLSSLDVVTFTAMQIGLGVFFVWLIGVLPPKP